MPEKTTEEPRGRVMAIRPGRVSRVSMPIPPNVRVIEVRTKTEWVNGRPVIRLFLPDGSTIVNEPKPVT